MFRIAKDPRWECTKVRGPNVDPQIVGFPHKDTVKVPKSRKPQTLNLNPETLNPEPNFGHCSS